MLFFRYMKKKIRKFEKFMHKNPFMGLQTSLKLEPAQSRRDERPFLTPAKNGRQRDEVEFPWQVTSNKTLRIEGFNYKVGARGQQLHGAWPFVQQNSLDSQVWDKKHLVYWYLFENFGKIRSLRHQFFKCCTDTIITELHTLRKIR